MSTLVPVGPKAVELAKAGEKAYQFARAARAENTLKAYESDWRHFIAWCDARGLVAVTAAPATVADYIAELADPDNPSTPPRKASTIQRRLAAIAAFHRVQLCENPTTAEEVRIVLAGIRRTLGTARHKVRPVVTEDLRKMVKGLPEGLSGTRDHALLLLGFAGAFRRSELVGLDLSDVVEVKDGLEITLRRSKTDQEGTGRKIGIPYGSHPETCPVRAWRTWLEKASIAEGPAFRPVNRHGQMLPGRFSDRGVARVIKRAAERAGMDASEVSGHSLRSGLATSAATAGVSAFSIANQTGHKSMDVLLGYIRDQSLFKDNAAASVGL